MTTQLLVLFVGSTLLLTGCASYRPIVDENEKFQKVGSAVAEQDIDDCTSRANNYLEKHNSEMMQKNAGRAAVGGAAIGGAIGLLTNGVKGGIVGAGLGAGVGAGSSAIGDASKNKLKPDEVKQRYISKCLAKKGYDVIGWK